MMYNQSAALLLLLRVNYLARGESQNHAVSPVFGVAEVRLFLFFLQGQTQSLQSRPGGFCAPGTTTCSAARTLLLCYAQFWLKFLCSGGTQAPLQVCSHQIKTPPFPPPGRPCFRPERTPVPHLCSAGPRAATSGLCRRIPS
jgi:hypothetical protein